MIKLKVEWHHKCQGCGTELVSDFFADSMEGLACPWCGRPCSGAQNACDDKLKDYIEKAIRETEEKANGVIIIQG